MTPSSNPPPSPNPAENTDLFDYALIRDYVGFVLRAPGRHKWVATGAFLFVAALAALSLFVLPFKYQVEARLLAQRNPLMGTLSNPTMNRDWDAPTRAAREVVLRRDNLIALCKQTDFVARYLKERSPVGKARDWVFSVITRKDVDPADVLEELVDMLETRLWVVVGTEGTVTITFQWPNRETAYHVVQAAVQSFLEARYASEISVVGETIAILQGHDARLQREIAATIAQVEEKERTLRIRSGPRRAPLVRPRAGQDEDLARMEAVLVARKRALADLEDYRQRRLLELQAQLAQQLGTFAPQHPSVVSTRQAIDSITGPSPQILALRGEVLDLEQEITRRGGRPGEVAAGTAAIQTEIAETRLRLDIQDPRLEFERTQLDLLLRQHSYLLDRIDSSRVEMDTAQAAFKYRYSVISPPQMPKKPIQPYGLLITLSGLVGGIAMAFFSATVVDLRSRHVVERWQVERNLDLPVLADVRP